MIFWFEGFFFGLYKLSFFFLLDTWTFLLFIFGCLICFFLFFDLGILAKGVIFLGFCLFLFTFPPGFIFFFHVLFLVFFWLTGILGLFWEWSIECGFWERA